MKYKGWRILAVVYMPHYFSVANTGVAVHNSFHSTKFGKEISIKPPYSPYQFSISRFCADKDSEDDIISHSVAGLKKQIDAKEEQ